MKFEIINKPDTFWDNKTDVQYPTLLSDGGSKYLVCESAGTAFQLASVNQDNIGNDVITNKDFNNWGFLSGTIINSELSFSTSDNSKGIYLVNVGAIIGELYYFRIKGVCTASLKISEYSSLTLLGLIDNGTFDITIPYVADATGLFIQLITPGDVSFEILEAKGIAELNINGTYQHYISELGSSLNFTDKNNSTGDGYVLDITTTTITLSRLDSGTPTELVADSIVLTGFDKITYVFNSGITILVNDIIVLSSTDTTYTEIKFILLNNTQGQSIRALTKDDETYEFSNFIDITGEYVIQNILNNGNGLDAKDNGLEFNRGFWNTGNTLDPNPNNDAGLIALWTHYAALNVLLGHNVTYAQLAAINLTGIPESDFTLTINNGVITDMASQPHDSEGNLKSHLQ